MSSKIQHLQRALAWLQSKNVEAMESLKIEVEVSNEKTSINLSVWKHKVSIENFRLLKLVFGPLTIAEGYSEKHLKGKAVIESGLEIHLIIYRAYSCENLDPYKMTEEDFDILRENIRKGLITAQTCKPVDGPAEED